MCQNNQHNEYTKFARALSWIYSVGAWHPQHPMMSSRPLLLWYNYNVTEAKETNSEKVGHAELSVKLLRGTTGILIFTHRLQNIGSTASHRYSSLFMICWNVMNPIWKIRQYIVELEIVVLERVQSCIQVLQPAHDIKCTWGVVLLDLNTFRSLGVMLLLDNHTQVLQQCIIIIPLYCSAAW